MHPDGNSMLSAILFDIRTPLTVMIGYSRILLDKPANLPADTLAWIQKWKPVMNKWKEIEAEARSYCNPDQEVEADWETLIAQFGKNLSDIQAAYIEAQELPMPEEEGAKKDFRSVFNALSQVDQIRQSILTEEYKHYWAKYNDQSTAS